MHGISSSEVVLGGVACQGWWLVVDEEVGPDRLVAGPFPDRLDADLAAGAHEQVGAAPVYGFRHADGSLSRRPSPQDWAWLAHLGEQLDRLPANGGTEVSDDDPLTTLVVELTGALSEAGLPLHDGTGAGSELGGACLSPEPGLGGIVVSWRQHDRMSVDRVHGAAADAMVQQVMNRAVADVLLVRGFEVEPFGAVGGHVVRARV